MIFWNTVTDEKYAKTVAGLSTIACCKDYCVLVTTDGDSPGQATLLLCNALGTPIESRYLEMGTYIIKYTDIPFAMKITRLQG